MCKMMQPAQQRDEVKERLFIRPLKDIFQIINLTTGKNSPGEIMTD